jgi:signal transduction histidine kinase
VKGGSDAPPARPDPAAALNARLLRSLVEFVRDREGIEGVATLAEQAGLEVADLERGTVWLSVAQFEALLAAARAMVASDEELRDACAYRLIESYGPLRFLLQATSPQAVFRQAPKTFGIVSRISKLELTEAEPNRVQVRYTTTQPESRLLCLSRQGQMIAAPTLWGLPRARLVEKGCVAHGDEACVYEMHLFHRRRWLPMLLGGLLGASVGALVAATTATLPTVPALAVIGLLSGYAYELRRINKQNLAMGEDANEALRRLVREEAEARLEIVALSKRQRQWTQLLEEQLSERNAAMQELVERIRRVSEERDNTLRGFSHDLGNPLLALMSYTRMLAVEGVDPSAVRDMEAAIDRMRGLLRELMDAVRGDVEVSFRHQRLEVHELADALKRRMRALVFGRDIRVSVFRSREAPEAIRCDRILFDRVVDNLLTNAAKYTTSGSIIVEVGGTPGHLTLKISDTGRGIPQDKLRSIFVPGGSDEATRAAGSFGVGLSVVVHLLARIGGRLEVMSKPDVGTTFWAHFPVDPKHEEAASEDDAPIELGKVLTIRQTLD